MTFQVVITNFLVLPHQMKDLTDYIKMREQMMISLGGDFQESEKTHEKITGRFDG